MQTLDVYDWLVAKIEAVVEHRRVLVAVRTLVLHHVQDQLSKLPVDIRDQITTAGKIESRLRQLERIDVSTVSTLAGEYRLGWPLPLVDQESAMRREIRQLERDIDARARHHAA